MVRTKAAKSWNRSRARLSTAELDSLKEAGEHADGGGLYLAIDAAGNKRWFVRCTIAGRRVKRGLGPYDRKGVVSVRRRADEIVDAAKQGRDLVQEEKSAKGGDSSTKETVREAFGIFWRNKQRQLAGKPKQLKGWTSMLEKNVFQYIGDRPVADVEPDEILSVLERIWHDRPETASRAVQRMRNIFRSAIVRKVRRDACPCTDIEAILGPIKRNVEHREAIPWMDAPRFVRDLRASSAKPLTRLRFEFLILTAARSDEATGALWSEVDRDKSLWIIPGPRMKGERRALCAAIVSSPRDPRSSAVHGRGVRSNLPSA